MYILDTNVISELRKKTKADPNVRTWVSTHPVEQCYMSAITVKELEYGTLLMERRDPRQGADLREWVTKVLAIFHHRVLPIDAQVAVRAASLHVPDPAPEADAYIAATALISRFTLVTRNLSDFTRFAGLVLINPWDA